MDTKQIGKPKYRLGETVVHLDSSKYGALVIFEVKKIFFMPPDDEWYYVSLEQMLSPGDGFYKESSLRIFDEDDTKRRSFDGYTWYHDGWNINRTT